jgi:O-antigen/teichoic acid export membrane protein
MYCFNEIADRLGFMGLLAAANSQAGAWLVGPFGGNRLLAAVAFFAAARWTVNLINIAYYAGKRVLSTAIAWLPAADLLAMVQFSTPLTAIFFLGWTLNASDLFLLKHLSTADELSNYAFAVSIGTVVALITQAVLTDWPRFYYEQMRDDLPDRDDQIARRVRLVLWLHVLGIVVLRVGARLAYDLFGADAYLDGLDYLHYLVLANFFFLAGNLFGAGIGYAKKTHLSILTFLVAGGLNVVLNLVLIPRFGAVAAALTTLLSNVVFAAASWWIGRRHYQFTHSTWHLAPAASALAVGLLPLHYLPTA